MSYIALCAAGITSFIGILAVSYNRFYMPIIWAYCGAEVRFNKCKNNVISAFNLVYQKIIPQIFTPSAEIFYYKNCIIVSSTTILELAFENYYCDFSYDYIIYEVTNERGETTCRYFENHSVLMTEFNKNKTIDCIPSKSHILSALLIIAGSNGDEFYDVTPTNLGVELQGNKLYSYNFIRHFFNITPREEYLVKIIDQDINEITLINNSIQHQVLHITCDILEIENAPATVYLKKTKQSRWFFMKSVDDLKDT